MLATYSKTINETINLVSSTFVLTPSSDVVLYGPLFSSNALNPHVICGPAGLLIPGKQNSALKDACQLCNSYLRVPPIFNIFLPVKKPIWYFILSWILHDSDQTVDLQQNITLGHQHWLIISPLLLLAPQPSWTYQHPLFCIRHLRICVQLPMVRIN